MIAKDIPQHILDKRERAILKEAVYRDDVRGSLIEFCKYTLSTYDPQWHHVETAYWLEQMMLHTIKDDHSEEAEHVKWLMRGDKNDLTKVKYTIGPTYNRVMVFEPPRHGKSELTSVRLPSFFLGHLPQLSCILVSYSLNFARGWGRATRDVTQTSSYRKLWKYKLKVEADEHWMFQGKLDNRYNMIVAGVDGGITGEGANVLLMDDPFKNYEAALSQVNRDTVWNFYTTTARTRLAKNGVVCLTMTRWHEDDLAGRLLRLAKEDPNADQWLVVELPASADKHGVAKVWHTGKDTKNNKDYTIIKEIPPYEALWPDRFTRTDLETTKATMGSRQYAALYGQQPQEATGNIYKRHWFNRWYVTPDIPASRIPVDNLGLRPGYEFKECIVVPTEFDEIIQSWDMAFKDAVDNDYVSGGVWGLLGSNKFLLDRKCEHLSYVDTKKAVRELSKRWPQADRKLVEDKANGTAIINDLHDEIHGLTAVEPEGSKEARAHAASADAESGNIYLPHPSICPWIYDFIECLCVFPNGLHDDDVDMYSQAIKYLKKNGSGLIGLWKREMRAKRGTSVEEDRSKQPQEEKDAMFGITRTKNMGKVMIPDQLTEKCSGCGNAFLTRGQEGYWKCNNCGTTGRDVVRNGRLREETLQKIGH